MGRSCGWLTLSAAISTWSDFALILEDATCYPANWRARFVDQVVECAMGPGGHCIVIVCEGLRDRMGVRVEDLADEIEAAGVGARSVVLGHVVRGGRPTARDRLNATRVGFKVETLLAAADSDSPLDDLSENESQARTCEAGLYVEMRGETVVASCLVDVMEACERNEKLLSKISFSTGSTELVEVRGKEFIDMMLFYRDVFCGLPTSVLPHANTLDFGTNTLAVTRTSLEFAYRSSLPHPFSRFCCY